MGKSVLDGRRILAVDDESDVLDVLETEIKESCPTCHFERATSYEQASERLKSNSYDVVILDIMGVKGFDLLKEASAHKIRSTMLTAHALSPEALKMSHDLGARAYLPKDKLGEIVPYLEDILTYEMKPGWKRIMEKLDDYFNGHFEPDWKKKIGAKNWY